MPGYGLGAYGVGIYGIGEVPPEPPYVHKTTTARLGESGIVLGETDEYGVHWGWQAGSDPWTPGPQQREVSGPHGSAHGSWNATDYYESRTQELSVIVQAPSHDELHRAQQRWMTAIGLRAFEFAVDEPFFGVRQALMRRDGRPTWNEEVGSQRANVARATASLRADDPLIYGAEVRESTTSFPSSTGGLQWPAQWPAQWNATVESGQLQLTNEGSEDAPVVWRIDGPVVQPTVTHVESQSRFRLDLEIGAGEWVTVDGTSRRVSAMGQAQASRRAQWSGSWLVLPPGTHTFAFGGAEGGTDARLTASWRDAWI